MDTEEEKDVVVASPRIIARNTTLQERMQHFRFYGPWTLFSLWFVQIGTSVVDAYRPWWVAHQLTDSWVGQIALSATFILITSAPIMFCAEFFRRVDPPEPTAYQRRMRRTAKKGYRWEGNEIAYVLTSLCCLGSVLFSMMYMAGTMEADRQKKVTVAAERAALIKADALKGLYKNLDAGERSTLQEAMLERNGVTADHARDRIAKLEANAVSAINKVGSDYTSSVETATKYNPMVAVFQRLYEFWINDDALALLQFLGLNILDFILIVLSVGLSFMLKDAYLKDQEDDVRRKEQKRLIQEVKEAQEMADLARSIQNKPAQEDTSKFSTAMELLSSSDEVPTMDQLAAKVGVSKTTARRYFQSAVQSGILEKQGRTYQRVGGVQ